MAAMVGARRALFAARYSPRGELAAALVSPARRVDSLPSLPSERGCLRSWAPYRGAGSVASEQVDGDYHREWGVQNGENYTGGYNTRSNQQNYTGGQYGYGPTAYQNSTGNVHQAFERQKVDQISDGNCTNRPGNSASQYPNPSISSKEHVAGSQQGHNGDFAYSTWQPPDQASSAYNHQSPRGGPPNTRERHDGTGYGTHSLGYNIQSNQHNYTGRPNGYGPSGQSYQNSAGNVQQVFQRHNDDQSGHFTTRSGNSASQYTSPSSFHKEHVAGVQQSHASQAYWSPHTANKDDIHRNHPGHFMNVNTD